MHIHHSGEHAHGEGPAAGIMGVALATTLLLTGAEFAGGYLGHSIALTSDAVHNLSDVPVILISWFALGWSNRRADSQRTFGYGRAGILAAFTNGILLIVVGLTILWEAFERLRQPAPVHEQWMIGLSIFALVINGGITLLMVRHSHDLNFRSILIHNLGDALSNVAILLGALAIHFGNWVWLDPLLGFAIALLVLWSTTNILKESGHILLEGMPRQMNLPEVARVILSTHGVQEVHDLHIWTLGTEDFALSCHVRIPDMHMEDSDKILQTIRQKLSEDFKIRHVTIQFERAGLPTQHLLLPDRMSEPKS